MTLRDRIAHAVHSRVYEPTNFQDAENIADEIMALLPSLPDGWVDFVQGVADARNGEGMFWTTPDRDQDQDVIDRMGDAAVAMLAARPTLPTASGWDDAAVERAAQRFYTRLTTPHGKWSANEHQALWVAAMRAALAALSTEPLETER